MRTDWTRRYHAIRIFEVIVRLGLIATLAACGGSDGAPVAAPPSVATVTVVPNLVTIAPGETTPLAATVADAAGNALSGRTLAWSSSNSAMVTVAANGVATGVAEGSATITATSEGKHGDATIVVGTATISPSINAGLLNACGVSATGTAFCWGAGFGGALGNGTTTHDSPPVRVQVSSGVTFASLATTATHSCGVTTAHVAYCWGGDGTVGHIGDGTLTRRLTPVPVAGNLAFSSVGVGRLHSCGLTTNGRAFCWGTSDHGEIGGGDVVRSAVPIPVSGGYTFAALAVGDWLTCGITSTGSVLCWGSNVNGDGTTTDARVPRPVIGAPAFVSISAGGRTACGVTAAGTAYCWGDNTTGQLGDGSTVTRGSPVPVSGGLSFAKVSPGDVLSCGLTVNGRAFCWGDNKYGGLGDGTNISSSVPVAVIGGQTFASISTGEHFACAVTTDGVPYCWGKNDYQQLGDGTTDNRNVPVRVNVQW
jgi:alpha-tubulin suppressor-like RCC1 family protein